MLTVEGIYDGENIRLLEKIPSGEQKRYWITFSNMGLMGKDSETEKTKITGSGFIELFGSWEDDRSPDEIISQIKNARKNSTKLDGRILNVFA